MKKILVLSLVLLISFSLYAGVFDLFYPDTSYYEMASLAESKLLGAFSFDRKVAVARDVEIKSNNCYIYYDKGRMDTICYYQVSSEILLFTDVKVHIGNLTTGYYDYATLLDIPSFRPERNGETVESENYTTVECTDNKVVFKAKEKDVRIELQEFDGWARKIVYKEGDVLYCRWIMNWKEKNGERIPTTEAFYIPILQGADSLVFKETVASGGFGNDYGTFTSDGFKELFNSLR